MTTTTADILLALLRRGPRTWAALAEAGLDRAAVLAAAGELRAAGHTVIVTEDSVALEAPSL